ncbi:DUF7504 family protein [Haladaptatus caseinilyticus]|uniref:DUF7504 family protein n=1 Tax=Haladaptatus caseinilyticus TaxID=2993314 RepID=UPI00224AF71D|nr:hypothetical protein [Haladaptatus caseinilyticus]
MLPVRDQYRSGDGRDFDDTLRALKRQGCTLLVTGAVSARVTAQATQRLLGDPHRERKRRLVFTDARANTSRTASHRVFDAPNRP